MLVLCGVGVLGVVVGGVGVAVCSFSCAWPCFCPNWNSMVQPSIPSLSSILTLSAMVGSFFAILLSVVSRTQAVRTTEG